MIAHWGPEATYRAFDPPSLLLIIRNLCVQGGAPDEALRNLDAME